VGAAQIAKLRRDAWVDQRRVRRSFTITIDAIGSGAVKRPDGSYEFDGVATRADAVFDYSADAGKPWREYRSIAEVGAKLSIESLIGAEITDDHPVEFVNPENARELGRGTVMAAVMDGALMRVRVIVRDAELLAKIFAGKVELSCGYTAVVVDRAGIHPTEGPYEAEQTQIIHNHLAVVDIARAGPVARLSLPPTLAGAGAEGDQRPDASTRKHKDMGEITVNGVVFKVDPTATTVPQAMAEAYATQTTAIEALKTELAAAKAAPVTPEPAPPPTPPAPGAPAGADPSADPTANTDKQKAKMSDKTMTEDQIRKLVDERLASQAKQAKDAADKGAFRAKVVADAAPHLPAGYDFAGKADAEILVDAMIAVCKDAEPRARKLAEDGKLDALHVLLEEKVDQAGRAASRSFGAQLAAAAQGAGPTGTADTARQKMLDRKAGKKGSN
jgi:hypothetical protein